MSKESMSDKELRVEVIQYIEKLYRHLNSFMQFTRQYNESKNEVFGTGHKFERSSSELINIRDSFMHFISFYEAGENHSPEQEKEQWNHIQEHGYRAAKDQFVFFCQHILEKDLKEWLQLLEKDGKHPDAVKDTRKLMHEVKNAVMNIRTSSANGIRITDAGIRDLISVLQKRQTEYSQKYYSVIKKVYDEQDMKKAKDLVPKK